MGALGYIEYINTLRRTSGAILGSGPRPGKIDSVLQTLLPEQDILEHSSSAPCPVMDASSSLRHESLDATLLPAVRDFHCEFRGIKYASIPARFEHSVRIDSWKGQQLDCTKFG